MHLAELPHHLSCIGNSHSSNSTQSTVHIARDGATLLDPPAPSPARAAPCTHHAA